jgi:DNA-binding MarR family transcriptional regulator
MLTRMPKNLSKSTEQAWIDLHRAHRLLLERVESALKRAGLPPLDWYDALLELRREQDTGLRQFQLGGRVLLSKHNLSRLIDRLEKKGLVRRHACSEDGRGNLIRITAAGERMLEAMWPVYGGVIESSFGARLGRGEAAELSRILGKALAVDEDT